MRYVPLPGMVLMPMLSKDAGPNHFKHRNAACTGLGGWTRRCTCLCREWSLRPCSAKMLVLLMPSAEAPHAQAWEAGQGALRASARNGLLVLSRDAGHNYAKR